MFFLSEVLLQKRDTQICLHVGRVLFRYNFFFTIHKKTFYIENNEMTDLCNFHLTTIFLVSTYSLFFFLIGSRSSCTGSWSRSGRRFLRNNSSILFYPLPFAVRVIHLEMRFYQHWHCCPIRLRYLLDIFR